MLDVDARVLGEEGLQRLGIVERVSGGPVAECHEALRGVAIGLVAEHLVAHLGEHGLERRGVGSCGKVVAFEGGAILLHHVGVGDGGRLPFHTQKVARNPGRYVLGIEARAGDAAQLHEALAVDDIDHRASIGFELLQVIVVEGVAVGILDVVVDPHAMQQV